MDLVNFPTQTTMLFLKGLAGYLEVAVERPKKNDSEYIAIICHPHPLYHGTMDNKVVTTLSRALRECSITAIRFNFRGVGKSEGHYADTIGEVDDLMTVVNWLQQVKPKAKLILAGFSFGSYIAFQVANKVDCKFLISIAPPVHHFDFKSGRHPTCPWLVIQGNVDEIVPPNEVFKWVKATRAKLITFKDTGHFFHGRLLELREVIQEEIQYVINGK